MKDLEEQFSGLVSRYNELQTEHEKACVAISALRAKYEGTHAAHLSQKTEVMAREIEEKGVSQFAVKVLLCKKCFGEASVVNSLEMVTENHKDI